MCPTDDAPLDPDRAAILARRQRFIALALSSLATTGAGACTPRQQPTDAPTARPQACLEIANPDKPQPPPPVDDGGAPLPCLSPPMSDEPAPQPAAETEPATPKPCLKVAGPRRRG